MAGLINWKKVSIPASNPDADHCFVGIDIADDLLYVKNSAGVVTKFPTLSQVSSVVLATQLAGIVFNDTNAVTASDTILVAIGKLQAQLNLNFKAFAREPNGLVNDTSTLFQFLRLSASIPAAGDYKIACSYSWSLNDGAQDFVAQLDVNDGTVIHEHRQEPKDVGGGGIVLPNTTGGTTNTGTDQRHPASFFDVINLPAGPVTVDLDFAGSQAALAAAIYRGAITIERWG
jgi:hypothetical protein